VSERGRYRTPAAFRAALEERQKARAIAQGVPFDRLARVDLYFRFLARLLQEFHGTLVIKGGVALELRLQRARMTADIDLRAVGSPDDVYRRIRQAALVDLGDFLTFLIEKPDRSTDLKGDGVLYEGRRFQVQPMLANKRYRDRFNLDVAFGDVMVGSPETVAAPDALSFMGVNPPMIPLYPLGTHLAEKLHAYTLPRDHPNSRMKDLLDIALVAREPSLKPSPVIDAVNLRKAMEHTFSARATHVLPGSVPPPPPQWNARYLRERELNALPWETIAEVHNTVCRFLDPILQGAVRGTWEPHAHAWSQAPR
jgi:predicted nucleotidyltransferase component of viral defense system